MINRSLSSWLPETQQRLTAGNTGEGSSGGRRTDERITGRDTCLYRQSISINRYTGVRMRRSPYPIPKDLRRFPGTMAPPSRVRRRRPAAFSACSSTAQRRNARRWHRQFTARLARLIDRSHSAWRCKIWSLSSLNNDDRYLHVLMPMNESVICRLT